MQVFISGLILGILLGILLCYVSVQYFSRQRMRSNKREIDRLTEQFQELFRQNFTRLASGSRPDRPSHSPKVVEIRVYGKTRSSRNDGRDRTNSTTGAVSLANGSLLDYRQYGSFELKGL